MEYASVSGERARIAYCLDYPLFLRGGVSVLVEALIEGLAGRYAILLVSPDSTEDIRASAIGSKIHDHISWAPDHRSPRRARELAEILCGRKIDLAHFHIGGNYGWGNCYFGCSPVPHLHRRGVPVVSTIHLVVSLLAGYCDPQMPWLAKLALAPAAWLAKVHVLRHTRAEIAVSLHDLAKVRRWYRPLSDRFRQIYHSRLRLTPEPPPAVRTPTILNVGHIARRKGQHVLVEAFARIAARHPEWQLQLVGPFDDGADGAHVREIVERAGLQSRVHLPGSRDEVLDLMRHAGIYVQPSIDEALGLALQEALFAGCPSIGTDAGGIPELIADGDNGLLVPKGDVPALAGALDRLMSDAALRARLGERARPSILERGMIADTMIEKHHALYREILAR